MDGTVPADHGDRLVDLGALGVGELVMSSLMRLMSRRIRVISSSAGVASARAHSSTPSMAAARRSRVRSRSSR